MAKDESPDVRLRWPNASARPSRKPRSARRALDDRTPPTTTPAKPAGPGGDERNLLRLRLPADRAASTEILDDVVDNADLDDAASPTPSDHDQLMAEVARLRSEVNALQRRIEELELNDRHRTDVGDYAGGA